jgi:hypothetical protein
LLPTWRHALPAQPTGHAVEWHAAITRWLARVLQTQPASDRAVLSSMSKHMLCHIARRTRCGFTPRRSAMRLHAAHLDLPGRDAWY